MTIDYHRTALQAYFTYAWWSTRYELTSWVLFYDDYRTDYRTLPFGDVCCSLPQGRQPWNPRCDNSMFTIGPECPVRAVSKSCDSVKAMIKRKMISCSSKNNLYSVCRRHSSLQYLISATKLAVPSMFSRGAMIVVANASPGCTLHYIRRHPTIPSQAAAAAVETLRHNVPALALCNSKVLRLLSPVVSKSKPNRAEYLVRDRGTSTGRLGHRPLGGYMTWGCIDPEATFEVVAGKSGRYYKGARRACEQSV